MSAAGASESRTVQRIDALDAAHTWHPFTQMQEYAALPRLHIDRAQGCWLYDAEGRAYLDANASIWTNVHGHNDPELNAALTAQLGKMAHTTYLGLGHGPGAELAAKLAHIAPGRELNRVFYSDNGSNAVEIALKLSFQFWQLTGCPEKTEVVGMSGAYHGDTFGTMAVGDSGGFHERFAHWCFPVHRFSAPVCAELGGRALGSQVAAQSAGAADAAQFTGSADGMQSAGAVDDADAANGAAAHRTIAAESLAQLEGILTAQEGRVAAVVVEPWMQGSAGMRVLPKGFLKDVQTLCRRYGAHLIVDEVFVGFGRMGHLLVSAAEGVEPDFLCLAKGLTAGYVPLAATVTTDTVYEAFLGRYETYKTFFHGHTFTGNPLGAAVALCNISKLERMLRSGALAAAIERFDAFFRALRAALPASFALRQRGMAGAVDLPLGDVALRRGMAVAITAREHGICIRPLADSLLIVPPLIISASELEHLFNGLLASFRAHNLL